MEDSVTSPVSPQGLRHRRIRVWGGEEAERTIEFRAELTETARKHKYTDESIQEMHALVRQREHWFCERIHALEDQVQDRQNRIREERAQFEKQIKTSEKNHWKAELANVKLLQDKQELKLENAAVSAKLDQEIALKEKARQESFERAYAVAGLTEELQDLKKERKAAEQAMEVLKAEMARKDAEMEELRERAKLAEQERATWQAQFEAECNRPKCDASIQTDVEEDVSPVVELPLMLDSAVQTDLPIRTSQTTEIAVQTEELQAPSKEPDVCSEAPMLSCATQTLPETNAPTEPNSNIVLETEEYKILQEEIQSLQQELDFAKAELEREQEGVKMMHLECQFQRCLCRRAEREGRRYVYDVEYDMKEREKNKRKAEEDLPLPDYISLKQRKTTFKAKHNAKLSTEEAVVSCPIAELPTVPRKDADLLTTISQTNSSTESTTSPIHRTDEIVERSYDDKTDQAGPAPVSPGVFTLNKLDGHAPNATTPDASDKDTSLEWRDSYGTVEGSPTLTSKVHSGVLPLEEAASIPLPPSRQDDPEPTALLEEMTQVMINPEPVSTTKHFAFSTSTASRQRSDATPAPSHTIHHSHSAIEFNTEDLFDLAPPVHTAPRPNSALENQTNISRSPIRVVPAESPQSHTMHAGTMNSTPSASPPPQGFRTIQIPLKDAASPLRSIVNPAAASYPPSTPKPRQKPTYHTIHQDIFDQTPKRAVSTYESHTQSVPINDENKPPVVLAPGTPQWRRNAAAQIEARRRRIERDASNRSMP